VNDLRDRLQEALPERYTIEGLIGRGGAATVYLARESHPSRQVAIKVLDPGLTARIGRERFLREVDVASSLTHPHVVPIFAAGEAGGLLYYVMPYVAGESLRRRLRRGKQLPLEEAVGIAHQVARALDYAHQHNVVHRDIKPENILLHDEHALVADFGIARAITAAGVEPITEAGTTLGTPAYMSPEQASGDGDLDGRTDIYSLACVLYEMIGGEPPFQAQSTQGTLARHLVDPVPSLRALRRSTPVEVEQVIGRALQKSRTDRYQSARAFAEALAQAYGGATLWTTPQTGDLLPARPHRRIRFAHTRRWFTGAVAAVLGVILVFWWQPWRSGGTAASAGTGYVDSLAVTVVENLTGDTALQQVSHAITHDIIAYLTRIDRLKVISLHSVEALADARLTTPQLADTLKVRLIVEAQLRRRADHTVVNAWLVDAQSDAHLWNETREVADITVADQEIARWIGAAVAENIGGIAPRPEAAPAQPSAGRDAYLIGHHWLPRRTAPAVARAIAAYSQAIANDSGFAPAYAGLSQAYALSLAYRYRVNLQGYLAAGMALALADRATELDPELADGYASRAYIASRSGAPLADVSADCERILELEPSDPDGPSWCSRPLAAAGRIDSAFAESERAVALDPQSPGRRLALAYEALGNGRYAVAIREAQIAGALEPELVLPRAIEARAHLLNGDAERCASMRLGPHAAIRATCLHTLGRVDEAAAIIDSVEAAVAQGTAGDPTFTDVTRAEDLASYYAWTGDAEAALRWLTTAYELSPSGIEIRVLQSRLFDGVRHDPAFARGVEQVRSHIWERVRSEAVRLRTW
jgi:serine/threonine-protein kinase